MRVSDGMEVGSAEEQPAEGSSVQTKMLASWKGEAGLSRDHLCLKVPKKPKNDSEALCNRALERVPNWSGLVSVIPAQAGIQ